MQKLIQHVVAKCADSAAIVNALALSCLSSFAYLFPLFNERDPGIIQDIVLYIHATSIVRQARLHDAESDAG